MANLFEAVKTHVVKTFKDVEMDTTKAFVFFNKLETTITKALTSEYTTAVKKCITILNELKTEDKVINAKIKEAIAALKAEIKPPKPPTFA